MCDENFIHEEIHKLVEEQTSWLDWETLVEGYKRYYLEEINELSPQERKDLVYNHLVEQDDLSQAQNLFVSLYEKEKKT